EAFKSKRFAFGIGWFKLITAIIAAAAVSLGFGGYFSGLFGVSPLIGAILIVLMALFFNIYSVKSTLKISAIFVGITIFGLLLIIFTGSGYIGSIDYLDFTFGWGGVFTSAALIFFAFLGFEDVANLSEEAKNPRKVLPKAIIISIIVSTIIYTIVSLVSISVVPWNELAVSASPLTQVAEVTMGSTGSLLMSLIALFATGSTVFVLFFAYSRMIFGMAERGSLPLIFLKISKKRRVPYTALICVGIITILFILLQDLKFVASLTDFGALSIFMVVNLSLIVLRYKKPHLRGQFKVPLNIGRFPILPAIGAGFSLYMLTTLSLIVAILSLLIFVIGVIIFSLFIDKK
ncbi:MAG: amino acid permease, partial [Candidatus Aenigmarchaeota archaeon]|nr:amino acid permease [Candidatus Aenigmarchaeota archaeon]